MRVLPPKEFRHLLAQVDGVAESQVNQAKGTQVEVIENCVMWRNQTCTFSGWHSGLRAAASSQQAQFQEVSRSSWNGWKGFPHTRIHPHDQLLLHWDQGRLLCGPRGQLPGESGRDFQAIAQTKCQWSRFTTTAILTGAKIVSFVQTGRFSTRR